MTGRLRAVSTCDELFACLSADPAAQWTVPAGQEWPCETLSAIEEAYPGRRSTSDEIVEQDCLRADVEDLFDAAARHDRCCMFPSAAGVPLGIPSWSNVEALLRLRRQSLKTASLLVLARAESLDNGPLGILTGRPGTTALAGTRSFFARIARTMFSGPMQFVSMA